MLACPENTGLGSDLHFDALVAIPAAHQGTLLHVFVHCACKFVFCKFHEAAQQKPQHMHREDPSRLEGQATARSVC